MDLQLAADRLRAQCPALRLVALGLDYDSAAATTPAAYMVAEEEQAEPPELIGSRAQRVELRFSVSLVVASAARQAGIGSGLAAAIEAARADVLDALRGWLPDGCDWPVEHRGGRLVASEVGRAVWSDTFAVGFLRE
ncbi:phage tail terminator protein [Thermomonas haemolytica]|uniref:Gp37 protein n=1 Tax=Thermomonas haemolytica TaxID=141949 RepID=A0A4V2V2Q1_9GAMM|nr:hypothetical protein [Thermomonas haemolytica]TCT25902.1 hypothetical protein EDC34_101228 [Thermomonas haemolytica]TNY28189.1 hypothetical protein BV505_11580 [Thermomonas haemolytica]